MKTAALLIGAALLAVGAAADGEREVVVTLDGREIAGPVRRLDRLRIIETGDADIYITDAAIRSARAAEPVEPEPVYLFNQDRVRGPKRGPIRPTVDRTQIGPLQPDGTRRARFSHPEQGPIELTLAITRITPAEYRHEAVEYDYANVHPRQPLTPLTDDRPTPAPPRRPRTASSSFSSAPPSAIRTLSAGGSPTAVEKGTTPT